MFSNITQAIEKAVFRYKYKVEPQSKALLKLWVDDRDKSKYFFTQMSCDSESPNWINVNDEVTQSAAFMSDIVCRFPNKKFGLKIGNLERISLNKNGVIIVRHFALDSDLTRKGLGIKFFSSIVEFFELKKEETVVTPIAIEFHEDHPKKLAHYRNFFAKNGVEEVRAGVWRIEL